MDDRPAPGTKIQGRDPGLPSLRGDWLCLDFTNSVNDRFSSESDDAIVDYASLVAWSWHAWLIDDQQRDALLAAAIDAPDAATEAYREAISLREAIYRVVVAIIAESTPVPADLAIIERGYRAALAEAHLRPDGSRMGWHWGDTREGSTLTLDRMLWSIAWSAVELLTSDQLHRVKQCPGCGDCGWLFYDSSKNGTRRWCVMDGCGSRAKMRRQYARKKGRTDD